MHFKTKRLYFGTNPDRRPLSSLLMVGTLLAASSVALAQQPAAPAVEEVEEVEEEDMENTALIK